MPGYTAGDALDWHWVWVANIGDYVIWDMGFPVYGVRVYPSQDHGPYPEEFNEYDVYVSNDMAQWTPAIQVALYCDDITNVRTHDGVKDYGFNGTAYRYVKIQSNAIGGGDFEIDAVEALAFTYLRVEPAKVEFWTPAYDKTFHVNVNVQNVTGLYGYEFKLLWNTTLLDCVGVNVTPPAEWGEDYFIAKNETDEALGRYWLAVSLLPPAQPFNGSAVLCTLTFRIAYDAIYPENVTSLLDLTETYLSDSNAEPISHIAVDGEYWLYSTRPEIKVEPSSYTAKKVETFSVNITVHNVVNLYSYEFKLGYDTALLDALSLNVGDFLKQPYYVYKFSIDDDAGVIIFGVSSRAPAPPVNGSGLLATITFKTVAIVWPDPAKNTSVHLYDTVLKTNLGITVPHGTVDGFYQYTPIPGDVNSDGIVNIFDLVTVARAFGTKPGEANWDPKADLKRDGLINIFDVVLVAKNYGRTDP
jgi:hypothetical protein